VVILVVGGNQNLGNSCGVVPRLFISYSVGKMSSSVSEGRRMRGTSSTITRSQVPVIKTGKSVRIFVLAKTFLGSESAIVSDIVIVDNMPVVVSWGTLSGNVVSCGTFDYTNISFSLTTLDSKAGGKISVRGNTDVSVGVESELSAGSLRFGHESVDQSGPGAWCGEGGWVIDPVIVSVFTGVSDHGACGSRSVNGCSCDISGGCSGRKGILSSPVFAVVSGPTEYSSNHTLVGFDLVLGGVVVVELVSEVGVILLSVDDIHSGSRNVRSDWSLGVIGCKSVSEQNRTTGVLLIVLTLQLVVGLWVVGLVSVSRLVIIGVPDTALRSAVPSLGVVISEHIEVGQIGAIVVVEVGPGGLRLGDHKVNSSVVTEGSYECSVSVGRVHGARKPNGFLLLVLGVGLGVTGIVIALQLTALGCSELDE